MTGEQRFWQVATLLTLVLVGGVALVAEYEFSWKKFPERRLQRREFIGTDPLSDLSKHGDVVALDLAVAGEPVERLVLASTKITNVGRVPILPSDFHEPLSIAVAPPWRILAVATEYGIDLAWSRRSDERFEAAPVLMNPGDITAPIVYLTYPADQKPKWESLDPVPLSMAVRITSLKRIEVESLLPDRKTFDLPWLVVHLEDWAVLFLVGTALLFQALYLGLLSRAGLLAAMDVRAAGLVLVTMGMSICAAEVLADYLFPERWNMFLNIFVARSPLLNLPFLCAHLGLIFYLYRRGRPTRPDSNATPLVPRSDAAATEEDRF